MWWRWWSSSTESPCWWRPRYWPRRRPRPEQGLCQKPYRWRGFSLLIFTDWITFAFFVLHWCSIYFCIYLARIWDCVFRSQIVWFYVTQQLHHCKQGYSKNGTLSKKLKNSVVSETSSSFKSIFSLFAWLSDLMDVFSFSLVFDFVVQRCRCCKRESYCGRGDSCWSFFWLVVSCLSVFLYVCIFCLFSLELSICIYSGFNLK